MLVAALDNLKSAGSVAVAVDGTVTIVDSPAKGTNGTNATRTSQAAPETSRAAAAPSEPARTGSSAGAGKAQSGLTCHAEHPVVGVRAWGVFHYPEGTFDLLEGSQVDMRREASTIEATERRRELIKSGDLEEWSGGIYLLKNTVRFDSPSGAGVFVFGGTCDGWTEWKGRDGRSLDEIYPREGKREAGRASSKATAARTTDAASQAAGPVKKTQPAATVRFDGPAPSADAGKNTTGKNTIVKVYMDIPGCGKRAKAVFYPNSKRTDVLEDSFVRIAEGESLPKTIKELRAELVVSGKLVARDVTVYALKQRVSFSSPSAAAEFVLGTSASGPREWKDSWGVELGDLYPELFRRRRSSA